LHYGDGKSFARNYGGGAGKRESYDDRVQSQVIAGRSDRTADLRENKGNTLNPIVPFCRRNKKPGGEVANPHAGFLIFNLVSSLGGPRG